MCLDDGSEETCWAIACRSIRSVNAGVNDGTCNIVVNSASVYGDQSYFQSANNQVASPYEYIGSQNGVSLSYISSQTLPNGAVSTTNYGNVSTGDYYTAALIGTLNANYGNDPNTSPQFADDPRILKVILLPPRGSAAGGQAAIRILNAAPDLGFSQLPTASGQPYQFATGTVNVTVGASPAATFSGVNYGSTSDYQNVSPGSNLTVTVTLNGANSTTMPVPTATTTISPSANTVYTLVLAENNTSPPTYDLKLLSE